MAEQWITYPKKLQENEVDRRGMEEMDKINRAQLALIRGAADVDVQKMSGVQKIAYYRMQVLLETIRFIETELSGPVSESTSEQTRKKLAESDAVSLARRQMIDAVMKEHQRRWSIDQEKFDEILEYNFQRADECGSGLLGRAELLHLQNTALEKPKSFHAMCYDDVVRVSGFIDGTPTFEKDRKVSERLMEMFSHSMLLFLYSTPTQPRVVLSEEKTLELLGLVGTFYFR